MLLSSRGLTVSMGDRVLFRDIDFDLSEGEAIALQGASGSGKTTLLRVLAGLQEPQSGRILFKGRVTGETGWPAYRRKVVLVMQRPVFLDSSVFHNLQRPYEYGVSESRFDETRAVDLLVRVGLSKELLTQEARTLSAGEQQRIGLVRALLLRPSVALLDEPTSALDEEATNAVEGLLKEVQREQGLGLLLVSHDRAQVARMEAQTLAI